FTTSDKYPNFHHFWKSVSGVLNDWSSWCQMLIGERGERKTDNQFECSSIQVEK
ncbi:hypothetical protein L9F63_003826, partial [Diploptera punctata]